MFLKYNSNILQEIKQIFKLLKFDLYCDTLQIANSDTNVDACNTDEICVLINQQINICSDLKLFEIILENVTTFASF